MNGTVVRARRIRSARFLSFFFFFSSGAQRKDLRRGRSKSLHGSAVILILVSPGGNVSFGNHGTLFSVSERVFYAERWAKKGEKWTRTSDVGAASCCYFLQEKEVIKPRKTGDRFVQDAGGFSYR